MTYVVENIGCSCVYAVSRGQEASVEGDRYHIRIWSFTSHDNRTHAERAVSIVLFRHKHGLRSPRSSEVQPPTTTSLARHDNCEMQSADNSSSKKTTLTLGYYHAQHTQGSETAVLALSALRQNPQCRPAICRRVPEHVEAPCCRVESPVVIVA